MNSELWRVKFEEVGKSLVSAVFAAFLFGSASVLSSVIGVDHFNLFSVQWGQVFQDAVNAGFQASYTAFTGTIALYLSRDKNGAVFGVWGGNK